MTALLSAVLITSLLGSLHCAGMCGGLVALYAGGDRSPAPRRHLSHVAYNGGRLLGYMVLGAAAGGVGAAVDLAGRLAGWHDMAAPVAGAMMIAWGVLALIGHHVSWPGGLDAGLGRASLSRWLAPLLASARRMAPLARAGLIGLGTAALPCGWLWAFLVTAASTGTVIGGAIVMLVFWLGTVPILLATAAGAQVLARPLRRHLPVLTATALVSIGVITVMVRPRLPLPSGEAAASSPRTTEAEAKRVRQLQGQPAPCCQAPEPADPARPD